MFFAAISSSLLSASLEAEDAAVLDAVPETDAAAGKYAGAQSQSCNSCGQLVSIFLIVFLSFPAG